MVYHPDLAPLSYPPPESETGFTPLAIGWLSKLGTYTTGDTPEAFRANLLELCAKATVRYTFGYHFCELCGNEASYVITQVQYAGEELLLGNGEIWTIGKSVLYAAPTLIYHYVTVHNYQPPYEYIESVLTTEIDSAEYRDFIEQIDNL